MANDKDRPQDNLPPVWNPNNSSDSSKERKIPYGMAQPRPINKEKGEK